MLLSAIIVAAALFSFELGDELASDVYGALESAEVALFKGSLAALAERFGSLQLNPVPMPNDPTKGILLVPRVRIPILNRCEPTNPPISSQGIWKAIISSISSFTTKSSARNFRQGLGTKKLPRATKSKKLAKIVSMMEEATPGLVIKDAKGELRGDNSPFYVDRIILDSTLRDVDILKRIYRLVVPNGELILESYEELEDAVIVCGDCGLIHHVESKLSRLEECEFSCDGFDRDTKPEELPSAAKTLWCEKCEKSYVARILKTRWKPQS